MRLRQRSRYILAITLVLLGVILAACGGGASISPLSIPTASLTPSLQDATAEPVLFIHGINPDNGGFDCNGYTTWGDAKQVLDGSKGAYPVFGQLLNWDKDDHNLITIGYYSKDTDCNAQLAPNNPNGLQVVSNPFDYVADVLKDIEKNCDVVNNTQIDNNTSIEQLSCMVAWYIWDKFSNNSKRHTPQYVRVVTHSMGGLIIRYALYASRNSCVKPSSSVHLDVQCLNFPPPLMVSNVVTIDAPHGGVLARPYNFCVNSYLPCTEGYEMTANYPFMNDMYKYAQSPQGQGGTMWMLMGSACAVFSCGNEGIEPFLNSRYMANAWKKVWYTCSDGLTCYDHGSFLTDSSRNWETNVKFCSYCQAGDDGPKDTHNMPRSLYMMKYGLLGIDPRDDPYRGVLSTNPKPTPTPTLTPTPAAKPTMSVPAGSGLNLEEGVPICDVATDPEIATWQEGSTGSHLICTPAPDNEGQVAQMMPVNANQLAEMDLQSINGASYGLTTFAVSMNVDPFALTNGGADSDVYVGFNVATPLHGCGGTIFALNAQWQWILERVSSCSQITTLQQGQVAQSAWTNSAPRISITLTLDNQLRASVNGTPIVSVDNVQVSDPVIGLVAQAVPGSNVGWTQYTNLSLQTDNCFLAHQCTDVIAPTP